MCTVNVAPAAEGALAGVLTGMRAALATEAGCPLEAVIISGVDFGTPLGTAPDHYLGGATEAEGYRDEKWEDATS